MACLISTPCAAPSAPLKGQGRVSRAPCPSAAHRRMMCSAKPLSAGACMNSAAQRPPCSQALCWREAKGPSCGARRRASHAAFTRRVWHRRGSIRSGLSWCGSRARTISCMPPMRGCAPAGTLFWKRCAGAISARRGGCSLPPRPAAGSALSSPWMEPRMRQCCPPRRHAGMPCWPPTRSGLQPSICIFA